MKLKLTNTSATFLIAISLFVGARGLSDSLNKSSTMLSLGDSITAGTIAGWVGPQQIVSRIIGSDVLFPNPGANYFFNFQSTFSWATGQDIASHYVRLENALKRQSSLSHLYAINAAVQGQEFSHLPGQARFAVDRILEYNIGSIPYMTLLIGNNDICYYGEASEWLHARLKKYLNEAFDTLNRVQLEGKTRVLVSGLPPIWKLGSKKIREARSVLAVRCEWIRDRILGVCKRSLRWDTPEQEAWAKRQVITLNHWLSDWVKQANHRYPNFEFYFSDSLLHEEIRPNMLSSDCFHPNSEGQKNFAERLWNAQPWFR
ncbi:MAG: hypothetical protein COT74_10060 [Bdellovibrionales bacterium CG10_big_fil_rev_8_21_14_0_10_45_34]|nr:MAG: hypothetical protein COT74_10060 [Bdellovibrionales bacterium CG10_big_fil_rev_8_21_14_0_10_45_34]